MNELREKEAAAKAHEEFLKQELIHGIKHEVETKSVEWEAELLFEIEKTPYFTTWLREKINTAKDPKKTVPQIIWHRGSGITRSVLKSGVTVSSVTVMPDSKPRLIVPHANIYETAGTIIAGIPVPAEYTLENERMRVRYRVLSRVIDSVKATMKEEERVVNLKLAEEARVAAEEKAAAVESWRKRRQAVLDRYADDIRSNMKTPLHSFTGIEPSNPFVIYVRYDAILKILTLESLRVDASDTKIENLSRIACPATMKAPESWNNMFKNGMLPFLTCCPVCSAQVSLNGIHATGEVASVICGAHYGWNPTTNLHYRNNLLWDPRDPDGSIAAKTARDAKITAKETEIAKLQKELEDLRKGPHFKL
jgi:hypothetical protein